MVAGIHEAGTENKDAGIAVLGVREGAVASGSSASKATAMRFRVFI
jgi:hypothetical protein